MTPAIIPRDAGEEGLDWLAVAQSMADGHDHPRAQVTDSLLHHADDALLNRSAWIEGLGIAVLTHADSTSPVFSKVLRLE